MRNGDWEEALSLVWGDLELCCSPRLQVRPGVRRHPVTVLRKRRSFGDVIDSRAEGMLDIR